MEQELQKKTIRVKFLSGFTSDYKPFYEILSPFYRIEVSDRPDYVFFSVFSEEHLAYKNCVKIFYTGECLTPDFNLCDYAIGYDYISFGDRYLRYPLWYYDLYRDDALLMQKKHEDAEGILSRKTDFCSFVVSNGDADPIRQAAFEALNAYKRVDSGGRFMNNIGLPDGVADKLEFDKRHKFSLAFENSAYPGYATEKLIQAFAAQTVPIYWGDPTIKETFNPKAFINASDFESLEDLVEYVKKIDADDALYLEMLRQPALLRQSDYVEEKQLVLEAFLRNIFDQDREKAFRRNMLFWGARYQDNRLNQSRISQRFYHLRHAAGSVVKKPITAIFGQEFYDRIRGGRKK